MHDDKKRGPVGEHASLSRTEWLVCAAVFVLLPLGLLARKAWDQPSAQAAQTVETVRLGGVEASDEAQPSPARLDLNRAVVEELKLLPGIGAQLARAIVAHREAQGPYLSIWDLSNIKGITRNRIERLEPLICVRAPLSGLGDETESAPGSPPPP